MTKLKITLFFLMCCILSSCDEVKVKHHWGLGWPDTWEATDGKTSIGYYNGNCCCVAEQVLKNLADRSNKGEFTWDKMKDESFKKEKLAEECKKERIKQWGHE